MSFRYKVVIGSYWDEDTALADLHEKVEEAGADGWQPQGGVFRATSDYYDDTEYKFYQAMIKPKVKEDNPS